MILSNNTIDHSPSLSLWHEISPEHIPRDSLPYLQYTESYTSNEMKLKQSQ